MISVNRRGRPRRQTLMLRLLLLAMGFSIVGAGTEHVFVKTKDGVWLASDTLTLHGSGHGQLPSTHSCKVVISQGRLIFNIGSFRDSKRLIKEEALLPFADINSTLQALDTVLLTNHMDMKLRPDYNPKQPYYTAAVVEVANGLFQAAATRQADDATASRHDPVTDFRDGIPFGFTETAWDARQRARKDKSYRQRILEYPKNELLSILEEATARNPGVVGPPFTVFLLQNDGTVIG